MTSMAIPNSSSAVNNAQTAASTTGASGSTGSGSAAAGMTQGDFMQLLTAQLQYQNPLNPADPTQMAQEFASISTVDGINKLNTSVSSLQSSSTASQMSQASALVGKQVALAGNALTVDSKNSATGAFNLDSAASDVKVSIIDTKNNTIAGSLDLGAMQPGMQNFSWTGGTQGNQYSYSVNATDSSGNAVGSTSYSVFTVAGVNLSSTKPTLSVEGYAGTLPVSDVQSIIGES